jgi:hypothetical protein
LLAEQFGELIDNDKQRREGSQLGSGAALAFMSSNSVEIACRAKHFLSAVHFTGQRVPHSGDQFRLVR